MEPNWEQFRVDPVFDSEGVKEQKLYGFMQAFIDWRKQERTNKPSKKKAGKKRN